VTSWTCWCFSTSVTSQRSYNSDRRHDRFKRTLIPSLQAALTGPHSNRPIECFSSAFRPQLLDGRHPWFRRPASEWVGGPQGTNF
jgi:hypothetical protein